MTKYSIIFMVLCSLIFTTESNYIFAKSAPCTIINISDKEIETLKQEQGLLESSPIYALEKPYRQSKNIAHIQSFLKAKNYYLAAPDGIYGPLTASAVVKFREENSLPEGDFIDSSFLDKLAEIYEKEFLPPAQEITLGQGKPFIVISLSERTLYLVERGGNICAKFPVAVGKPSTPSPIGEWQIIDKGAWGEGFGSRWLGLNVPWGIFGIHGTNQPYSIGASISGGCIRMFNRDVIKLYDLVEVNTYVFIINEYFGVLDRGFDDLYLGTRGSHVYLVQRRLKQLGFYKHKPDGVFGNNTYTAVIDFQKAQNLTPTGKITAPIYERLGLFYFE